MAVKSPLAPGLTTSALNSSRTPFSPYSDSPWPSSAAISKSIMSLSGNSRLTVPSPSTNAKAEIAAPSPIAPSPINSETTEFADVDEVADEGVAGGACQDPTPAQNKTVPVKSPALKVDTSKIIFPNKPTRSDDDEPPASVIYAPAGFGEFSPPDSKNSNNIPAVRTPPKPTTRNDSTESIASDITVKKTSPDQGSTEKFYDAQMPPTPLQTSIPTAHDWLRTPRAQTRQDLGVFSRPGSSLASISENDDYMSDVSGSDEEVDHDNGPSAFFRNADDEIKTLNQALSECWTLCNTLAGLSNVHRERIFNFSGHGNSQQQAWKSCWTLCQNLYDSRLGAPTNDIRTTLDYCRDFCQDLFDIRARDNETADSVLRVSFELNNHLFNTHDRHLPEAFRERTLDFYITLCHRLMKQKVRTTEEPDHLLKSCWSLAETLFSIRQNMREERKPDEELLGSAIQACWDLCDLFREGWSSKRPDSRQTPRPSQTTFTQAFQQAKEAGMSNVDDRGNVKLNPETPTTMIDESTTDSPYEAPAPNIVVLAALDVNAPPHSAVSTNASAKTIATTRQPTYRWPSTTSLGTVAPSAHLHPNSTGRSSSTQAPSRDASDDHALILLKSLFVRAALLTNRGFVPAPSAILSKQHPPHLSSLPLFVKTLPESAFGAQAWQMDLLDHYRRAVTTDNTFKELGSAIDARLVLPSATDPNTSQRLREEIAHAVKGMVQSTSGWSWLKDLFRFAFGVYIEEVHNVQSGVDRRSEPKKDRQDRNDDMPATDTQPTETPPKAESVPVSRSLSRHSKRGSSISIASNSAEKRTTTTLPKARSL